MINKITLIGRVGGEPETKRLESGAVVTRFSLATSDSYKDKEGNFQESTEWHNIVAWRDLAERAEKSLKKGTLLYVEGKVTYRKYNDKEGVEKTVTDIVANSFRPLEKRESSDKDAQPQTTTQPQTSNPAPPNDGSDLPF